MADVAPPVPHLRPGDVLTCADCGAQVTASFSSGAWKEGYAVALAWPDRTEVTHYPSARCPRCHEKAMALGKPELPPQTPVPGPPPPLELSAGGGSSPEPASPAPPPPAAPAPERGAPSNAPAPSALARFIDLADRFHAETGMWPPGQGVPEDTSGTPERERQDRWVKWLNAGAVAKPAAHVARPKPPKGQLTFL